MKGFLITIAIVFGGLGIGLAGKHIELIITKRWRKRAKMKGLREDVHWDAQHRTELALEGIATDEAYKTLEVILKAAYEQAATGKGKERHADGQKFEDQPIVTLEKLYHSGVLFQAAKKMHESQRLSKEAAVKELLGAISYVAARIIYLEGEGI